MKHLLLGFVSTSIIIFFSCINNPSTSVVDPETGTADISICVNKVGALGKTREIDLENLYIKLYAVDEDTIFDTVSISGHGTSTINRSYNDLVSLLKTWTFSAETRDIKGILIHSGSAQFIVPASDTIAVTLNIDSKYSMLRAHFFPIRDSVTRCELLVEDTSFFKDSTFSKQSLYGDTVSLSYDYLQTNVSQRITLNVFGEMWGFDTLLYTSDTLLNPLPGESKNYNITLSWVGPALPPPGSATMSVILGAVGTTTVNGYLESKLLFEDEFNDGFLDSSKWLLSCTHGPSYGGIPTSTGSTVFEEEGILKVIQAQTDWGGRVFSKTITIDSTKQVTISCRTKVHYANQYLKGSDIRLIAIDPIEDTITTNLAITQHLNYDYSSTYLWFGFRGDTLLPPIWDEWFDEKLIYDPITGTSKYILNETDTITSRNLRPMSGYGNKVKIDLQTNGWYTGHYSYYDYIRIDQ
jgi:hypothetical protein